MKDPIGMANSLQGGDSSLSQSAHYSVESKASVELRPKPRLDKPFKLTICVTQTCNMDCKLCYADCGSAKRAELTTAQWKVFIDELVAQDVLHIFFEGGEPFESPDFEEIVDYASGKLFVAIRTHATTMSAERAKRLKKMGVGRVYVDLFSPESCVQDELTGRPGSFDASVAGMKQALAAGLKVTILGILSRKNYRVLQNYISLAEEIGADQVGILRLYPLGRARKHWAELSLTLDEMMAALNTLRVSNGVQLMQSWHPKDGNCCWQTAAVSPTGESIGCPYMREYVNYGNITEVSFLKTWNHPIYKLVRSSEVDEACAECSATQGSHGGCRATAYAFRGRLTASDPYCINTNKGVDLRDLPQWLIHKDA